MSSDDPSTLPPSWMIASGWAFPRFGFRMAWLMRQRRRRRSAPGYSPSWIAVCSGIVPRWDDSCILEPMRIDFTKMHGAGNDFIVFDLAAGQTAPPAHQL